MADTVGKLIKEARTKAGLTQEQLARKVGGGMTAAQISRAERGEEALTQEQLKKIAKATGVTQASLLSAARESKPAPKQKAKTTAKSTAKSSAATGSMKVTAAEKKLVEAYRKADSDARKAALRVLQGECGELVTRLLGKSDNVADDLADQLGDLIGGFLGGR